MELRHSFSMVISGPSRSGKSVFTERLIRNAYLMIKPAITRVVYIYNNYQKAFENMTGVEFYDNFDVLEELKLPGQPTLLIFDDFMTKCDVISEFFWRFSHHANLSVIFISQNFHHQGRGSRDLSLSTQYICLMKNPRDKHQITVLAKQMFPGNSKFLVDVYRDVTAEPYSYLFLDLTQQAADDQRVMTNIFPGESRVLFQYK